MHNCDSLADSSTLLFYRDSSIYNFDLSIGLAYATVSPSCLTGQYRDAKLCHYAPDILIQIGKSSFISVLQMPSSLSSALHYAG